MKKPVDNNKIIETLYEELKRKDDLIEKLRKDNKILIKTAMKATESKKMIEEKLQKNI